MPEKVSVVVPIYKVENYLERCINSIISQSYSNLEILLVNDGSPDNCGAIAEIYAKKDSRIMVLHKKNGGLSDARNYGMRFVTGEYTLFVDSDDWLHTKMVEIAVEHMKQFKADVVQTAFYYAYDNFLLYDQRCYSIDNPPMVFSNTELMKELMVNEKVKNFAWGKLFRTELIKDILFKKGVLFEDVFWTYKVFQHINKYVLLHQPLCFYYHRDDSIVAAYSLRNLDILKGMLERHQFIKTHYKSLADESYKGILKESILQYNLLIRKRSIDRKGKEKKKIKMYIKNHKKELKRAVSKDTGLKVQLLLFLVHPYINILYLAGRKGLRKLKIVPRPISLTMVGIQKEEG